VSPPYLRDDLAGLLGGGDPFATVAALNGEVYRAVANRRTLRFVHGRRAYFAKLHWGPGWGEIFKNLATLRLPVLGARNEFEACCHLAAAGVPAPTVAAFGERGMNPARRESFVICDALEGRESLEDLTNRWLEQPPRPAEKRRLIAAVAGFARDLHGAGVVHRDLYVCHLLLDVAAWQRGTVDLAVIDLHRAQIRRHIPRRWLRRDLAALLFSVLDLPLTRRDWLRFLRVYRGRPLREVLDGEAGFWDGVVRRAEALYHKGQRKGLVQGRYRAGGLG
jgi:heptose I phosphotransferase